MSKQRYDLLRLALGCFMSVTTFRVLKDFDSVTSGDFIALGLGIIAAIVDYRFKKKDTAYQNRE